MQIHIFNPGPALSAQDFDQIEQRLAIIFPEEYKAFLQQYNGGRSDRELFFHVPGWPSKITLINDFLGFVPERAIDIDKNMDWLSGRLPKDFLQIANDPGGNRILISMASDSYGQIYFWDHENEPAEPGPLLKDYSNIYLLACSFTKFLDQLKWEEDL